MSLFLDPVTQQQAKTVWPASSVVALAYVDQLTRNRSMPAERARAVKTVLERLDGLRTGKENGGGTILDQADALAAQLESDAAAASGRDAVRLRSLAATIKGRTTRMRS